MQFSCKVSQKWQLLLDSTENKFYRTVIKKLHITTCIYEIKAVPLHAFRA